MNNIVVYLSSTKYHWWNFRSYIWKSKIIKELLTLPISNYFEFIDPLTYESEEPVVCLMDIKDIDRSDYIICYIDKITIGTLLELGYCLFKNKKKKLFVLTFNKNVVKHPWIACLCKGRICCSYKECCSMIYKDYLKKEQKDGNTTNTRTI